MTTKAGFAFGSGTIFTTVATRQAEVRPQVKGIIQQGLFDEGSQVERASSQVRSPFFLKKASGQFSAYTLISFLFAFQLVFQAL